ncbi:MAG: adenylate/guanylate cyclase domain-containing protein [Chitinophagaceae bacterium]|nr:adenylate/guanylate cyclase domain-containing protein [Chitinophagaceae bacterium]
MAGTMSKLSSLKKYRYRVVLFVASFWTVIDLIVVLIFNNLPPSGQAKQLVLRETIVFLMSAVMGYLLVFVLRKIFRHYLLWVGLLLKSLSLIIAAFVMNTLLYLLSSVQSSIPLQHSFRNFFFEIEHVHLLLQKMSYWLILILITQLIIEVNEKYSPGVFRDILLGKYVNPKTENRIVAFIDLADSTTIAEKLGHTQYFKFIREFIYNISEALIEYGGQIYQYVGDEIVVSWPYKDKNISRCLKAIIEGRRNIQKASIKFKRDFDIIPEFRVGIHVGEVTVGEIGVIKKDIAMSGDTMNTTARIRSACSDMNKKFIVSKDFIEKSHLEDFQAESLGPVELKGKRKEIELFSLKI